MHLETASALAIGTLLVAVPIVLHLVMRQRPKHFVFPALRFVQRRKESNRRKLQLRHWILLLLRCAAVFLLGAALARPYVPSAALGDWLLAGALGLLLIVVILAALFAFRQKRGRLLVGGLAGLGLLLLLGQTTLVFSALGQSRNTVLGREEAPVAAVLIFDTSPRMQYLHQSQTRIELAQERAAAVLEQLPRGSRIAVIDSQGGAPFFDDRRAAQTAVDKLRTAWNPRPLAEIVRDALAQMSGDFRVAGAEYRREFYIFTDRTTAAWPEEYRGRIATQLEEAADTNLYVIDVGVEQPRNVSLGQIQLARQVFAKSRGLKLQATVRLQSPGEDAESLRVKMYVEQSGGQQPLLVDGRMIEFDKEWLADQQVVVSPGKPATVELGSAARKITQLGTHHGRVQIVDAADGLPVDDERHFTIRVREAWPVLVVAPDDVDQQWFVDALAPEIARRENQAEYDITTLSPQEFERTPGAQLARFAAVALLDPPPLADVSWRKLVEYARAGGGVALFLGRNARFDSFNGQEAQRLLPGKLIGKRRARPTQPWYLSVDGSHPVTQPFAAYKTQDLWRDMPVRQHWWFRPLQPEADIFLRYTNGYPAALETRLGQGRVITLTTPVSDSANRPDWWNRIPTAYANDWIFVVLADSIVQHVIQADNVVLNYQVGGAAMVELPDDTGPQRFTLFTPSDEEKKVTRSEGRLAIELAGRPGAYRLKPIDDSGDVLGVTANLPPAASDLTRAPRARLDEILGEENYSYSTGVTEIERQISSVRGGRRLYDYLLLLLALIVGLEHLLSNRFYRRQAQHARTAAPSMA